MSFNKNNETERDVESAYGSDVSSNSNFVLKRETFSMEEPTSKNNIWYKLLKQKIREYMILEATVVIILVILLINSYRFSSQYSFQNQETNTLILNLQSQFNSFQKQSTKTSSLGPEKETEKLIEKENEKMNKMLEEVLKEVRIKSAVQVEKTQSPNVLKPANNSPVIYFTPKIATVHGNTTFIKFNAASLISGATIDTSKSSTSNLNSFFKFDQSSLVLVDRPEPPIEKEWCTEEKEPVLTVNLAKYVNPIAVSYQHSKWNETIPDDAPKIYDVVSCLDFYCEKWEPLVSNCVYNSYDHGEQLCPIPSVSSLIGKVQFRFRENHGNTERICVSLVRVYAETEEIPKQKLRSLTDAETCSDLKYDYHNKPFSYNNFDFKNCTVLYSKECCEECPECCEECDIQDVNSNFVFCMIILIILSPIFGYVILLIFAGIGFIIYGLFLLVRKCFVFT